MSKFWALACVVYVTDMVSVVSSIKAEIIMHYNWSVYSRSVDFQLVARSIQTKQENNKNTTTKP